MMFGEMLGEHLWKIWELKSYFLGHRMTYFQFVLLLIFSFCYQVCSLYFFLFLVSMTKAYYKTYNKRTIQAFLHLAIRSFSVTKRKLWESDLLHLLLTFFYLSVKLNVNWLYDWDLRHERVNVRKHQTKRTVKLNVITTTLN